MIAGVKTRRWSFVNAQTNLAIITPAANEYVAVYRVAATCSNSNTGDVAVDIGIATTTLPTITNDSAIGGDGVFFSHPGIAKGGGEESPGGGNPIAVGAPGDPVRITNTSAAGGALRVIISFRLVDTTPPA